MVQDDDQVAMLIDDPEEYQGSGAVFSAKPANARWEFLAERAKARYRRRWTSTPRRSVTSSTKPWTIALASQSGLHKLPDCKLSINFMPNAVYRPETCIRADAGSQPRIFIPDHECLMFEVTEGEKVENPTHLVNSPS